MKLLKLKKKFCTRKRGSIKMQQLSTPEPSLKTNTSFSLPASQLNTTDVGGHSTFTTWTHPQSWHIPFPSPNLQVNTYNPCSQMAADPYNSTPPDMISNPPAPLMSQNYDNKNSQCFLIYRVDPPPAAKTNPSIKHALLYMPYNHGEVSMVPRNLLCAVDCPPDLATWPSEPKFVLSQDYSSVMLLHPNNTFSHIALPGANLYENTPKKDSHGRPLPSEYIRRTLTGKTRGTNFRPLDIYLLKVGTWTVLNKGSEAKLKVCPGSSSIWYDLVTEIVSQGSASNEIERTTYGIDIQFSNIKSITVLDKWQLLIHLHAPPMVYRSQMKLKPKSMGSARRPTSTHPTACSVVDIDTCPFTRGQLRACLQHRIMLAKCWSTKVMDFLLDLMDPFLANVKFLEHHQLFHDPNTEFRAGQVYKEAYEVVNSSLNPEPTSVVATSVSSCSRVKDSRLNIASSTNVDDSYTSSQMVINAVMENDNMSTARATDPEELQREETGAIPQHILAEDTSTTPLELQLGMDYANSFTVPPSGSFSPADVDRIQEETSQLGSASQPMLSTYHSKKSSKSKSNQPSVAVCTCTMGKCMSKRCGCLKNFSNCTFDCSCVGCENPLNVLKVVHKVPIERMQRDRCLIYNIIKNPHFHLKNIQENKVFNSFCCDLKITLKDILFSESLYCVCEVPQRYEFSWCLGVLVPEGSKNHCDICDSCRQATFIHCTTCNKCYDAGMNGSSPCQNCLITFNMRSIMSPSVTQRSHVRTAYTDRSVAQSTGASGNNGMDNQDALLNPFGQSVDSSHQQLAECLLESVHNLHLPSLLANVSQSPFSDILGQGIESLTNSFSITSSEGAMSFGATTGTMNVGSMQPLMDPISQVSLDSSGMPGEETGLGSPMTSSLDMPQLPLRDDFPGIPQEEDPTQL